MGLLTIMDIGDKFHYQKSGCDGEWRKYLIPAPSDTALSFAFYDTSMGNITKFEAKRCDYPVSDKDPDVLETIDLTALDPVINKGNGYFQQTATTALSNLVSGLYYYYITDGLHEKKSELFCIKDDIIRAEYIIDNNGDFLIDNLNDKIYQIT